LNRAVYKDLDARRKLDAPIGP